MLNKFIIFIATGFYSGLVKYIPGTFGSLIATVISYLLIIISPLSFIIISLISLLIGNFICQKATMIYKNHDDRRIVWDEFVGVFIAFMPLVFLQLNLTNVILAFFLFRFFDITKLGLIGKIDKAKANFSILLDDVIAGLYSALILIIIDLSNINLNFNKFLMFFINIFN